MSNSRIGTQRSSHLRDGEIKSWKAWRQWGFIQFEVLNAYLTLPRIFYFPVFYQFTLFTTKLSFGWGIFIFILLYIYFYFKQYLVRSVQFSEAGLK